MIEKMFPQTVSNILDYTAIKEAAKKYVEETFVQIVESFGKNLVLQSMDAEHLAEVAKNVSGNPNMTVDELLDYINTDNVYHEFEFVNELMTQFPEGVEYKEFEVTGWGFPESNIFPFNQEYRSFDFDGQPMGDQDSEWEENFENDQFEYNLLLSRFGRQFVPYETGKRVSGRRASWGNSETWMTTGGFGKPASIHINVDEERTVFEENGLTAVENWLGTVSNKLPVNLYIEINDNLSTTQMWSGNQIDGLAGSTNGYKYSFPYYEEENFCTNDPDWEKEEYYVQEPQTENYPVVFWIETKKEHGDEDGYVCKKQIYTMDDDTRPLADEYKPYLNKKLLSNISGIPVAGLDGGFWRFLINLPDIIIRHKSVQIDYAGANLARWIKVLENSSSESIGFMFTDGRIYITDDDTDFSSHIFDNIDYGDDGWIAITDYNPTRGHGIVGVIWQNYGIESPFYPLKYMVRSNDDIECTQEYANNIIEVSALHLVADEEGFAYPSLADYLVENYFGAVFAIVMPSTWFDVRKKYNNKDNPIPLN